MNAVFGHIVSTLQDVAELFDLLGHHPAGSGFGELETAHFHCSGCSAWFVIEFCDTTLKTYSEAFISLLITI